MTDAQPLTTELAYQLGYERAQHDMAERYGLDQPTSGVTSGLMASQQNGEPITITMSIIVRETEVFNTVENVGYVAETIQWSPHPLAHRIKGQCPVTRGLYSLELPPNATTSNEPWGNA